MTDDNPYMMENTPEEEQRVKEVAARRHTAEFQVYIDSLSDEDKAFLVRWKRWMSG